jgi:hypothetical protein
MTTTEPDNQGPSDPYPRAWRPAGAPPFENNADFEPPAVEAYLGSLSSEEFIALCNRARKDR